MKGSKIIVTLSLSAALIISQGCGVFGLEKPETSGPESNVAARQQTASELLKGRKYAKQELIVTYDDSTSNKSIRKNVENHDATAEKIITANEDEKAVRVKLDQGDSMKEAIQEFQNDRKVVDVQPNYRYRVRNDDPYLNPSRAAKYQYQISLLDARGAWDILSGSHAVTKVAAVDTGMDAKHQDLQANMTSSAYVRTLNGQKITSRDDTSDHGTHVAGIIAADYGNGYGGAGVASGYKNDLVKFMMVGGSQDGEYFYSFDIVNAINYAVDNGARVINMSFGGESRDRLQEKAILDGVNNRQVVFVAAAGNDANDAYNDPGSMGEVIDVAAADEKGVFANSYSNYGTYVDVMAPGSSVLSTTPGDSYEMMSGTSMASPMVAAIAAMMLDANPNLTAMQVQNIIKGSTVKPDGFSKDRGGYGMVSAKKCVENAKNASASVEAESITQKLKEATVTAGDDICLEYRVLPATSLSRVTWSSSDASVASVDQNGRVTGNTAGTVTVTAKTDNGKTAACEVTVNKAVPVESVTVSSKELPSSHELAVGDSVYLKARIMPGNASNKEIYWKSDNESVATVDESGTVEGVGIGTATITGYAFAAPAAALSESSPKMIKGSISVTVKNKAEKIVFTKSAKWIPMGKTFEFGAVLQDENGKSGSDIIANDQIIWSVNDRTVAAVDSETGAVTPKKPGVFYLTASYSSLPGEDADVTVYKKVIVAKKTYKGKSDYNLRQYGKKKKTSVKLKWKKNPVAAGYIVSRSDSRNGKFKTVKTISSGSRVTCSIKTKKNGYYKVRAFYKDGGKTCYYGYSNVVKAVVKK
ncbi:MAG: S8 family serine peptidase [Hornefia butyriciproducens]|uniref:S8 family serine peptidase n=1 Tax=Hornefia butyriciproducens TaxID=2652293 RepID=UPI002A763B43|nr:S8 family serine peptidase [Hornefia butyriciproducens]MCI7327748.1 S8 family serine peptidase [Clostridiales bacterium]MDY2990084.1 S8 family serine peptidase [Hornefia butyriciproducens]